MAAYYNENDRFAAQWLRNLIARGMIPAGDVDDRSIEDVRPKDLRGYAQCHFFAGIGGWPYAMRLAGWPDERPVWTGSPPCQPFSDAGKGRGFADERHLWPVWLNLIKQCRPPVIFGEQVEAAIRHGWLDLVQDGVEGLGYAFAAAGLPAACVGAPHIRQRLWFVAHYVEQRRDREHALLQRQRQAYLPEATRGGEVCELADANNKGLEGRIGSDERRREFASRPRGLVGSRGNAESTKYGGRADELADSYIKQPHRLRDVWARWRDEYPDSNATGGFWRDAEWIECRDGKKRAIEPGTFPLADGVPSRVGRLRAYGNAIVPQVAAEFVKAFLGVEIQCN